MCQRAAGGGVGGSPHLLLESLRYEPLPYGIYVSLVEPGGVRTETFQSSVRTVQGEHPAYRERRARMWDAFADGSQRSGLEKEAVARIVARIVRNPRPRLRYPVGTQAHSLRLVKALLPERVLERVVVGRFNR